jgi:hypothetical protein
LKLNIAGLLGSKSGDEKFDISPGTAIPPIWGLLLGWNVGDTGEGWLVNEMPSGKVAMDV